MLLSRVRPIVLAIRRARNLLLRKIDAPVVVLLYHRVATLASDPQLLAVSPENFRQQMCYLKDKFPLVRFEDDWSDVRTPSIAVTFDDGYADNALNALPILEEVGIPATFFVSTGNLDFIGPESFWEGFNTDLGEALGRRRNVNGRWRVSPEDRRGRRQAGQSRGRRLRLFGPPGTLLLWLLLCQRVE